MGRHKKIKPISFEQQIAEWDKEVFDQPVDWQELCQKLQQALAKSYVEAEDFEKKIKALSGEIAARDIIINYLEKRRHENVTV